MSRLISIVYKPKRTKSLERYVRVPLESANIITNYGIEGDTKGGHRKRQLNIMSAEMVEQLRQEGYKTAPGELGEQLVIAGLDVDALKKGERLQLGDSVCVEITGLREPCDRFEAIQGKSAAAVEGRVGVLAKVIEGGTIKVGDEVKVLEPA
jgi:MOSC domain-containing protein YiiM